MPWYGWVLAGLAVLLVLAGLLVLLRGRSDPQKAWQHFRRQREQLEAKFFALAAASGKPRGLRWMAIDWESPAELAREPATGKLAVLVGITIQFEAIAGSDMEGLPAVGNLRNASAVFFYHRGRWHTTGRAVFNLNPDEAITHFHYERLRLPDPRGG
jgi:hypothetical protein